MITVGIDISLTGTGICVLRDNNDHVLRTIKSKPSQNGHIGELLRLKKIVSEIEDVLIEEGLSFGHGEEGKEIEMVAIEGLAFMARNTTALVQLSGLSYLVRSLLYDMNISFLIVQPTSLKKFATGKGNGSKDMVILDVFKKYGVTVVDNNQSDAFILAKIAQSFVNKEKVVLKYEKEVINSLHL